MKETAQLGYNTEERGTQRRRFVENEYVRYDLILSGTAEHCRRSRTVVPDVPGDHGSIGPAEEQQISRSAERSDSERLRRTGEAVASALFQKLARDFGNDAGFRPHEPERRLQLTGPVKGLRQKCGCV
jgi:hypothetical protein